MVYKENWNLQAFCSSRCYQEYKRTNNISSANNYRKLSGTICWCRDTPYERKYIGNLYDSSYVEKNENL